jgi:hypothetical protein
MDGIAGRIIRGKNFREPFEAVSFGGLFHFWLQADRAGAINSSSDSASAQVLS